jgi:hypothetical protein
MPGRIKDVGQMKQLEHDHGPRHPLMKAATVFTPPQSLTDVDKMAYHI